MARLPRMYRVHQVQPNGMTRTRHYQTPESAESRKRVWDERHPDRPAIITPSHVVTYPDPTGDQVTFDLPDTLVDRDVPRIFLEALGISPEAVQAITFGPEGMLVEYQPDPTHKRAPLIWRALYTEETHP